MHSKYLEDVFDERMFRYVDSVRQSETDNFGELVDLVKLDLTKDFMGIDLSGVDFSNTDLRGYNFSGSNLSNTFGTNIIIDNTTN